MSQLFSSAKALVKLSLAGEEPDPLTHFRSQKLLYYAQAWSVVLRDTELFQEEICAWQNGPVVNEVYRSLSDGKCAACVPNDAFASAPDLDPEDAAFLKSSGMLTAGIRLASYTKGGAQDDLAELASRMVAISRGTPEKRNGTAEFGQDRRGVLAAVWKAHNPEAIDAFVVDDFVLTKGGVDVVSKVKFKEWVKSF